MISSILAGYARDEKTPMSPNPNAAPAELCSAGADA